jgi:hypothetical protein
MNVNLDHRRPNDHPAPEDVLARPIQIAPTGEAYQANSIAVSGEPTAKAPLAVNPPVASPAREARNRKFAIFTGGAG